MSQESSVKVEELRVGNLLGLNLKEFPQNFFTVVEVAQHSMEVSDGHENHFFECEDMEPIPLSTDWLERFGFKLIEESPFEELKMKYWVRNRVCLFFNESPPFDTYLLGWADQRFGKYSVVTGEWIRYVHTLQNLYYALTGSEVTIKETTINK